MNNPPLMTSDEISIYFKSLANNPRNQLSWLYKHTPRPDEYNVEPYRGNLFGKSIFMGSANLGGDFLPTS